MLPLSIKDDEYKSPRFNLLRKVSGWFRSILSDSTSRNLFFFLLLNLSFAFVELLYGIWSNRYVRAEVLAGFVNGLFLIFTAFFIFSEGIERALEPPEVHHERLLSVSVLGFLVNLVGIFVFKHGGHGHSHDGGHGHSHSLFNGGIPGLNHGHSHGGHGHSHKNEQRSVHSHEHSHGRVHSHGHSHNQEHCYEDHQCDTLQGKGANKQILEGVFLHIVADTLGSIGVIISALLMQNYGLMIADPICSMLISFLIGIRQSCHQRAAAIFKDPRHPAHTVLTATIRKEVLMLPNSHHQAQEQLLSFHHQTPQQTQRKKEKKKPPQQTQPGTPLKTFTFALHFFYCLHIAPSVYFHFFIYMSTLCTVFKWKKVHFQFSLGPLWLYRKEFSCYLCTEC
ncbi:zinc transporter 7 isoform X2 [Narcine bancroftii]|uniref:zinc transporter 7 isoform X2 n=1 Tax=Narcine bancroftii TaxID=1343680 RepID=UPI003831F582